MLATKAFIRLSFFSFFLFVQSAFAVQKTPKKIIVTIYADSDYPPYSYEKDGHPAGIYYDLMMRIFDHFDEKYDVQIKSREWNQAIEAVKNGDVFAIYPPYKALDSRPWMEYSVPLFKENIAVFCNSIKKEWPETYEKSKIAINHGFLYPSFITKIFQKYQMNVFALKDNKQALEYYHKKKVDCYLNDRVAVLYTNKLLKYPIIFPDQEKKILFEVESYLGYSSEFKDKFEFSSDFMMHFNEKILQLKQQREIDRILDKYISSF
jgi:polar amino acid transport system substrate-binding protein